jgi:hypothetical protein
LDYDIVARYIDANSLKYVPIQIKEVVPERINKNACLNQRIENLKKYTNSQETTVVIQDNRIGEFNINDVIVPPGLKIQALWVLGSCVPDQTEWFIAGDFLENKPQIYKFVYPL